MALQSVFEEKKNTGLLRELILLKKKNHVLCSAIVHDVDCVFLDDKVPVTEMVSFYMLSPSSSNLIALMQMVQIQQHLRGCSYLCTDACTQIPFYWLSFKLVFAN